MMQEHFFYKLLIQLVLFHGSIASLFSDECLRHGLKNYYDPTTDSCWIVETTPFPYNQAKSHCNHMPGYDGHLAFPKTLNHSWIIWTKLGAHSSWIGLQHFGSPATVSNKSEWYYVYRDGRKESAADALWYSGYPTAGGGQCAYSYYNNMNSLFNYPCTTTLAKFICQYDSSTAHHETTLEHKCKQQKNWFWWEDDKSCLLLDTLRRWVEFSKLLCTHIPGYRGHPVFPKTIEKIHAIGALRDGIKVDSIWTGMERDRNMTSGKVGLFWRRFDGYKESFNIRAILPGQTVSLDWPGADYTFIEGDLISDWWDGTAMTLCEYGM
uniref:C-type lectin domain-containing protein n=1 Tax=Plectus sambesii TaxID=2011161 RepID=A0A914WA04_9BILA